MSENSYELVVKFKEPFHLQKIIKNEPFLFFYNDVPKRKIHAFNREIDVKFRQKSEVEVLCRIECEEELTGNILSFIEKRLRYSLGADEKLEEFYAIVEHDDVLSRYYNKIYGTRVPAAFDSFEAILAIICSQNVSFSAYKRMLKSIMKAYGLEGRLPTWFELLKNPENLQNTAVGYRAEYILNAARFFSRNDVFKLPEESRLRGVKGIGSYSVNLFYLIQGKEYSRFYVDVLMRKIFSQHYSFTFQSDSELERFAKRKFGRYCGLAGLYLQQFFRS